MTWFWACNCCVWVEAVPCDDETGRLFVHEDDLPPVTSIFKAAGGCWSVNPAAKRVVLLKDGRKVKPDNYYASCNDCQTSPDDPTLDDEPSGGGSTSGGEGGIVAPGENSGPGGGEVTEQPAAQYVRLIACSEAVDDGAGVYTAAPDASSYVRLYGTCWHVPTSPTVSTIPEGGAVVSIGGSYASCDDCGLGYLAMLCDGQDGSGAPAYWVRASDVPAGGGAFEYDRYCWHVDDAFDAVELPPNALIIKPAAWDDCETCRLGYQAVLCDGQNAPDFELWCTAASVEALAGEGEETVFTFRFRGFCFSVDSEDDAAMIPRDAIVTEARRQYEDCHACACGEPAPDLARLALRCDGKSSYADVWIPADVTDTYFAFGGACFYVGHWSAQVPPPDALIFRPTTNLANCYECGRATIVPENPPSWPADWVEDDYGWYKAFKCEDDSFIGWVYEPILLFIPGAIGGVGDEPTLVVRIGGEKTCIYLGDTKYETDQKDDTSDFSGPFLGAADDCDDDACESEPDPCSCPWGDDPTGWKIKYACTSVAMQGDMSLSTTAVDCNTIADLSTYYREEVTSTSNEMTQSSPYTWSGTISSTRKTKWSYEDDETTESYDPYPISFTWNPITCRWSSSYGVFTAGDDGTWITLYDVVEDAQTCETDTRVIKYLDCSGKLNTERIQRNYSTDGTYYDMGPTDAYLKIDITLTFIPPSP